MKNIDCANPAFAENANCIEYSDNNVRLSLDEPSNGSITIFLIIGGVILVLFFCAIYYKMLKWKQKKAMEEAGPEADLEREYKEYKKMKVLEMKAIEK